MAEWRELYHSAIHEPDPSYLELFIRETQEAMLARIRELNSIVERSAERHEILEAAAKLNALRMEKLGSGA